jgi:hypothetical protein
VNLKEIITKLTGNIYPVGSESEDEKRLDNFNERAELALWLVSDISYIRRYSGRTEYSVKKIGKQAVDIIDRIKEIIEE